MTLFVDVKYADMLGPRLRNYKRKGDFLWNFSCPVCGDSKTNKSKARGYIYKVKTGLFVKCHKCGYSTNLGNLVKYLDPVMYQEYVLENYKESGAPRSHHKDTSIAIPAIIKTPELTVSILDPIKRLDSLPLDHPAVKYVLKRKIPSRFLSLLYYAPRFKAYVNWVVPGKFRDLQDEHPRLIIPYFNRHGKCFAFQGRAFGKEDPKYYTIKVDDTEEKVFGLDRVNFAKRIFITEGPLDSLFIPNAIAVSGSSFTTPTIESLKTNCTVIYDNEPRSKELTNLIKKTIDAGFSVCMWPEVIVEKDINEMILAGRTSEEILEIIKQNTYTGVEAQLRFASWRKCE
jgi:transcription elongation factor Elf1